MVNYCIIVHQHKVLVQVLIFDRLLFLLLSVSNPKYGLFSVFEQVVLDIAFSIALGTYRGVDERRHVVFQGFHDPQAPPWKTGHK